MKKWSKIYSYLIRLIEPSSEITDTNERQNAMMFSALLLSFVFFYSLAIVIISASIDKRHPIVQYLPQFAISCLVYFLFYLGSRTRFYKHIVFAWMFYALFIILFISWSDSRELVFSQIFPFSILLITICGIIFRAKAAFVSLFIVVLSIVLTLIVNPSISLSSIFVMIMLVAGNSLLIIFGSSFLEDKVKEIKEQNAMLRNSEEKTRRSQMNLEIAQEISGTGNWRWDVDTNRVTSSDQFLKMFGLREESYFGGLYDSIDKLIHPDDKKKVLDALQKSLTYGKIIDIEFRILKADTNELRWMYSMGAKTVNRDAEGNPSLIIGAVQDITDRKNSEAKLEQVTKELIDTARTAGRVEIATGLIHNIGNVLNSAGISLALLRESVETSHMTQFEKVNTLLEEHENDFEDFILNSQQGKSFKPYIMKLGEHILEEKKEFIETINGLSDYFTHIVSIVNLHQNYSSMKGFEETVSMEEIIHDAINMSDASIKQLGIQLKIRSDKVPRITVDRHKALQIIINLISNAKYAVCELERANREITIDLKKTGAILEISIKDSGIGIPRENIPKIFTHGFTTKKNGHGFGLHNSANTAKELGGELTCHSDGINKGSTFVLTLPYNKDVR